MTSTEPVQGNNTERRLAVVEDFPTPPASSAVTDPEAAFVGALLHLDGAHAGELLALVSDEDIAGPQVRSVLGVIRACVAAGHAPDPAAVWSLARSSGEVAGENKLKMFSAFVATVYTGSPVPESARFYAEHVLCGARRRRLHELADRLHQFADQAPDDELDECVTTEVDAYRVVSARLANIVGGCP